MVRRLQVADFERIDFTSFRENSFYCQSKIRVFSVTVVGHVLSQLRVKRGPLRTAVGGEWVVIMKSWERTKREADVRETLSRQEENLADSCKDGIATFFCLYAKGWANLLMLGLLAHEMFCHEGDGKNRLKILTCWIFIMGEILYRNRSHATFCIWKCLIHYSQTF
jgi:hypothetical protein